MILVYTNNHPVLYMHRGISTFSAFILVAVVCNTIQCTYHSHVDNLYSLCLLCIQVGRTAIHVAAERGHSHVLSYLLKVPGAVPNARDEVTMSLYSLAGQTFPRFH